LRTPDVYPPKRTAAPDDRHRLRHRRDGDGVYFSQVAGRSQGPADRAARQDTHRGASEDLQSLYRLSFKESERAAVIGRRIGSAVAAGAPLLYSHFAPLEDLVIEAGHRAVGINVSASNAAGGLLVPGDLVDVVVTRPKANQPNLPASGGESPEQQMLMALMGQMSQAREWESELVLPRVRILAVGSHLNWSREQLQQTRPTLPSDTGSSAFTLQVKPDDAITLLEKTGAGSLKVSLLLCPKEGAATLAGAAVP
jgi:Flp pilus assembly protein CpaB